METLPDKSAAVHVSLRRLCLSLVVKRMRRVPASGMAVILVGLLVVLIWPARTEPRPPVLNLVSMEPAGMFDDIGEMWVVTLSISNPDNAPRYENDLFVKDTGRAIEAQVGNRWIGVEGTLACYLPVGQKHETHETLLLMPAGTHSCRLSLQYTGSSASFRGRPVKGRLLWLAERLPQFIRFRLSYKVWRWLGFNRYEPRSDWRQIIVELPLRPAPFRPGGASTGAHNPITAPDAGKALCSHFQRQGPGATEFLR